MAQYLLSVYQPEGGEPPANLESIMREVDAVDSAMHEAGVWVFSGGLQDPSSAQVLHPHGAGVITTTGPVVSAAQVLGGFTIVDVADRDAALDWAGRLARATTLPIEVRAFQG